MAEAAKILIVDDEPINLQILAGGLADKYQIFFAESGKKALEVALSEAIDLVLLDINLPDMSGYQVCQALKNNPRTKQIPIIFITGFDSDEDELKGLQMGAADYFTKPFKMPLVKVRVNLQIELKKKTDLLESLADLDGLTNIPNRRSFDRTYKEEWRRAARGQLPLSVCFIDVDFFKPFNDHYGHAAGDQCLVAVADALSCGVQRAGDLLARYGGEEFILLLPNQEQTQAEAVAEKVRASVAALEIAHQYSQVASQVTISVGTATKVPHKDDDPQALITSADEQLYIAKSLGRNRVSTKSL